MESLPRGIIACLRACVQDALAARVATCATATNAPLRFTIRDLFLMTMIVALAVGWWVDRRRLAREIRFLKIKPYYSMGPGRDFLPPKSYPAPVEFLPGNRPWCLPGWLTLRRP